MRTLKPGVWEGAAGAGSEGYRRRSYYLWFILSGKSDLDDRKNILIEGMDKTKEQSKGSYVKMLGEYIKCSERNIELVFIIKTTR